jgi:hypothetical protein
VLGAAAFAAGCALVVRDPVAALGTANGPPVAMVSRAEALDDLDVLMRTLEHAHPAPYTFRAREDVDRDRERLIVGMPASLTRIDLCLRLSTLVASINDGHTSMFCEELILREWERAYRASPPETQRVRMFPPFLRLDDRQYLIVGWPNDAPGVEPGDRLLRVNGQEADQLLAAWARETSHDTEAGPLARVASPSGCRWRCTGSTLHFASPSRAPMPAVAT